MSGTPSSGGPSSSQLITNEKVLERLFRAGYDRWIADAQKRLGTEAAASAPRVVSKVFHLAWTDRSRFHSQDELDAFLGANIQHQSARELSRRAGAQRMDKGGAEHKEHEHTSMGVDEAWDRLSHTLQGGTPEAYRQRASSARHAAAEHFSAVNKRTFNWKPMAAVGAVGLAVAIGGFMYINKAGEDRAIQHALNGADVRAYETSYGQQAKITLDDSTVVTVGPQSKLTVPKMFGLGLRSVKVEGTASFDVTRAMEKPFEVRSGEAVIQAKGTNFVVRRFSDDPEVVVHVKKGSVDVRVGDALHNVAEGMAWAVPDTGAPHVPSAEELAEASSWVDGKVSILNHTLREALPALKRWYGLDIHVEDQALLGRKVFINADITSKKAAIAAVEQSGGVRFTYIGENMAFQDTLPNKGGKKAPAKAPAKATKK
ncbi:MAG TPA: FecR domain-containing protein [Gemmatimonadaceae bacterium]